MEMNNSFEVGCPIAEAWSVLTDVERIAPCLPGAKLTGSDGSKFNGLVKVKVGPITAQYRGTAEFIERDDDSHRAVISAKGRDTRGAGNASATIAAHLTEVDANSTMVSVSTKLMITGKVAQFGRGVMADVSAKLMGQFADNLSDLIAESHQTAAAAAAADSAGAADSADSAADDPGSAPAPGSADDDGVAASPVDPVGDPADDDSAGPDPTGGAGAQPVAPDGGDASGRQAEPVTTKPQAPGPAGAAPVSADDDVEAIDLLGMAGSSFVDRAKKAAAVIAGVLSLLVVRRLFRRLTGRSRTG